MTRRSRSSGTNDLPSAKGVSRTAHGNSAPAIWLPGATSHYQSPIGISGHQVLQGARLSFAKSMVAAPLVVSTPKFRTPVKLILTAVGSPLMRIVR